jgi:hypothetical protein
MLADNALTTLDTAKNFLGIDPSDTSLDSYLEFSINSASDMIESYCERRFGVTVYREFKQGRGFTKLILENYPIVSLDKLVINDQDIDVNEVTILHDKGMLYRPNGGFPEYSYIGRFLNPKPDDNQFNIYVEYSAGYVLPKDASPTNPRTLPYDLELACLRILRIMKKDKDSSEGQNLILKREQLGDWMVEYQPEFQSSNSKLDYLDADIINTLDRYKRTDFFL